MKYYLNHVDRPDYMDTSLIEPYPDVYNSSSILGVTVAANLSESMTLEPSRMLLSSENFPPLPPSTKSCDNIDFLGVDLSQGLNCTV